tara:strand:+ start:275 stop:523 length:249 start_codon:yes stop_codon:yes gene_type:complete
MNSNGLQTIILGVIAINLTLLTIIQFTTKEETSKQQIIPVNSDGSIDVSIIDSYQLNVKIDEIDDKAFGYNAVPVEVQNWQY